MITVSPTTHGPAGEAGIRPAQAAVAVLYLVVIAAIAVMGFLRPTYNWDLLGYMGAAASLTQSSPSEVHAGVYRDAEAALPPPSYQLLTQGPYRADMATHAGHFMQQLPFYRVRPLFVSLVALLHRLGINPVHAVYLISAASYLALAFLVFAWLAPHLELRATFALSFLIAISPPLLAVAHLGTPDALSAALVMGTMYALLERRARAAFAVLLVLSVFTRSDNVVFALILLLYLGFSPTRYRLPRSWFLGTSLATLASYFAIASLSGNYGWATLFYHTFIHLLTTPAAAVVHISLGSYLAALLRGLRSIADTYFLLFTLIGVLASMLARPDADESARLRTHVLMLLAITVAVRYLLFPILLDRFLVPYYLLATVLLVVESSACIGRGGMTSSPRSR